MADLVHDDLLQGLANELRRHLSTRQRSLLSLHDRGQQAKLPFHPRAEQAGVRIVHPGIGPAVPVEGRFLWQRTAVRPMALHPVIQQGLAEGEPRDFCRVELEPGLAGTLLQKRHSLRHPGHAEILVTPVTYHVLVKDDVGIEDLAGPGVRSGGPHGEAGGGRDPAERVVANVLRVEVITRLLVAHLNSINEPDALEGLVPFENSGLDEGPVFSRDRLLYPEDDGVSGRRFRGLRVTLLQFPSSDVALEGRAAEVTGVVLYHAEEVPNPVVREARPVVLAGRQSREAVVDHDLGPAGIGNIRLKVSPMARLGSEDQADLNLDILGKSLDLEPRAAAPVRRHAESGKVDHEQVCQVNEDLGPVGIAHAADRDRGKDTVGIGDLDRVRPWCSGLRDETGVPAHHKNRVPCPPEAEHPLIPEVQRVAGEECLSRPACDGDRAEQVLAQLVLPDLHQELLFFRTVVQREQARQCLGITDDRLPVRQFLLGRLFRRRRGRRGCRLGGYGFGKSGGWE